MKHKPKESTCIRQNFALAILLSFPFWKRVVALPSYPIHPVLPILCTNSSISFGKS